MKKLVLTLFVALISTSSFSEPKNDLVKPLYGVTSSASLGMWEYYKAHFDVTYMSSLHRDRIDVRKFQKELDRTVRPLTCKDLKEAIYEEIEFLKNEISTTPQNFSKKEIGGIKKAASIYESKLVPKFLTAHKKTNQTRCEEDRPFSRIETDLLLESFREMIKSINLR